MQLTCVPLLLFFMASCDVRPEEPAIVNGTHPQTNEQSRLVDADGPIDRIEMRSSGWSSLDVEVTSTGDGRYRLSHPDPNGPSGTFRMSEQQFSQLLTRLEPYRSEAVTVTEQNVRTATDGRCQAGSDYITDHGGVWIRWVGQGIDEFYLAELGCDAGRHTGRNADLHDILNSFPTP